jgi:Right handed beta helix region
MLRILITLILALTFAAPAMAGRTLEVGPGKPYKLPSAAIRDARDGDRVLIAAGEYVDCAVVPASNLTIEGAGRDASTVITGKICQDKGILVTQGANITIRNLTLSHARSPGHNGAGIRAEGRNLTIDRVRFFDNENGILAAPVHDGTLLVRQSEFFRNGSCEGACAHGIYTNDLALVRIEASRFIATQHAHHIKSRSQRTEVIGCEISDGPDGTASYEIELPNGGALVVRNSTLEKGPMAENHTAMIVIGDEDITQPPGEITIENNRARNDGNFQTAFVENMTKTPVTLKNNRLSGAITPLLTVEKPKQP